MLLSNVVAVVVVVIVVVIVAAAAVVVVLWCILFVSPSYHRHTGSGGVRHQPRLPHAVCLPQPHRHTRVCVRLGE